VNPEIELGGVTVKAPQPGLTVGGGGADGKTTALIVASRQETFELTEPAGVEPHAEVSLYLAFIVQHPGVFDSKLLI
jgi:hypothetical protein